MGIKVCVGGHEHEPIQGSETALSAFYPPAMCRSVVRAWEDEDSRAPSGKYKDAYQMANMLWTEMPEDSVDN